MACISSINMNITSRSITSSMTIIPEVGNRLGNPTRKKPSRRIRTSGSGWVKVRAEKVKEKPEICVADELHYVRVPNTNWQLALWHYLPSHNAGTLRNHPVLMLSGLGTNAIAYDLSPQFSFARYMSGQGFDTWILEVRGAGFSVRESQTHNILPMFDDFQRQFDLFLNTNWDFDQLLKEDLPLVVDYIKSQSESSDGKLFGIGHSLGGILLYSMLSLCGFEGRDSNFAAITTLASTLDFSSSDSSFKLLLPLANSAEALNIPSIPIGTLLSMVHPLALRPPFLPSWLNSQISVQDMTLPEMFNKLDLKNFCTIPVKLLLQLATAFESTGLSDRTGTFFYKDHLSNNNVPILALAGDRDLICPPQAVYETVKMFPKDTITYKVFGEVDGPHYAHYDLVGGRFATKKVYPYITDFFGAHDKLYTFYATC